MVYIPPSSGYNPIGDFLMSRLQEIREVRERSNVSLGLCKKALEEAGNVEGALEQLQRWGELKAIKLAEKETTAGRVFTFVHHDNSRACMIEVNCQTDFGSNSEPFIEFCETLSMHILFSMPAYLSNNDIPEGIIDKQTEIFTAQVPEKAPEDKKPHIINNKLKKWFSEVCLVNQKCVVPDSNGKTGNTIEQLRAALVSKIGENVVIKRFVCWELGQ